MTEQPLVSVIMNCFNGEKYLREAIDSVLYQTYKNWELIFWDNQSTDASAEIVDSYKDSRIQYFFAPKHTILYEARFHAVEQSKGEFLAFLDVDDWWSEDKLQVCFDCINEKIDLVYHDMQIIADNPKPFSRKITKSWQVCTPVLMDLLLKGNAIVNSSVVVRKSLLQQIEGIDESVEMIAAEDYNSWLRIAQLTEQFVYLPRSLGYYLKHNQSISQKDMSIPMRRAVAEFTHALREPQKLRLEANLRYASLQFKYLTFKYSEFKLDLLFVLRHGNVVKRINALILLIKFILK